MREIERTELDLNCLVRDFAHTLERSLPPDITLRLELADEVPQAEGLRELRDRIERDRIREAIARHGGQIQKAADELGINRSSLSKLRRRLGI